jgi:Spy/CpxP family protein refolding chaperone
MKVLRLVWLGVAVFVIGAGVTIGPADAQQQKQKQKGQFGGLGGGPLLTAEAVEKLKLSADQKEKYAKIEDDYKDKAKAGGEKIREAFQSKDKDKIKDALTGLKTDREKLRGDYLAKVEALLNDDQKKTFADVKNDRGGLGGLLPGGGIPGLGGKTGPQVGGQFIPSDAQEKLKLSDEQKKKIESLQKELESKIMGVLTDEQKKQFEELKKGATQGQRPSTKKDI